MTLQFRIRLALVAVTGVLGVVAAGGVVGPRLDASAWYPAKAAIVYIIVMALAAVASRHHVAVSLGPANLVTAVRAMGVGLATAFIGEPTTTPIAWTVVGMASVMAALDGLDGWLARRTRMDSAFGARFDMETDALLVLVLSVLAWQHGKAGAWVLIGGGMRYLFVAASAVWPWLARPLGSTLRGKTIAVVFSVGLIVALAPAVPHPASAGVAAVVLAALTWSFAADVRRLHEGRLTRGA